VALSRAQERLLRRITVRKGREAEGVVLLEGPRVLITALDAGAELSFVLRVEGSDFEGADSLEGRLLSSGIPVVGVGEDILREMAQTDAPQGILAVARQPHSDLPASAGAGSLRVLILDAVQDPGNVGALIRSAAALGVDLVLPLDGTADPWSAKAIRASAGSAFRVPIHPLPWSEAHAWIGAAEVALLVADPEGEDVRWWIRSRGSASSGRWALVLGNEGRGVRPEVEASASARLSIPLRSGVESLNVAMAGAILMWALGPGGGEPPSQGRR
jgi:RNA methyltransferase, TrmH family